MATGPGTGGAPPNHWRFRFRSENDIFKPASEWQEDEQSHILILYLPGFLKHQIKAETDGNIIRVRGESLIFGNKWNSFKEEFRVPENCETKSFQAKFQGGILTIKLPRKLLVGEKINPQEIQKAMLNDSTPQNGRENKPRDVNPTTSNDEKVKTIASKKSLEEIVDVELENTKKDEVFEGKDTRGRRGIISSIVVRLENCKNVKSAVVLVVVAVGALVSYAFYVNRSN